MNLSPLERLHSQLALERIGVNDAGRLFRLPGENPDGIQRVLAARLVDGSYVAYLRDDLSPAVAAQLRSLSAEELFSNPTEVQRIVGTEEPAWHGRTCFFSISPQPEEYAQTTRLDDRFVVLVNGLVAAEAWSPRLTEIAAELAVETQPEFQRRGYGRQVAAAWASHQPAAGRIAFYSHHVDNTASAALARSLHVQHFMDNVNYS